MLDGLHAGVPEARSELFDECTLPVGLAATHDRR
jgi:hypothetical protein